MDGLSKVFAGRCFYDPKKMVAKWDLDIEVQCRNLTEEQQTLAKKIIDEHRNGYGISVLYNILNALAHAGFRGKIGYRDYFDLPPVIMIEQKVETDNTKE